ncbi:MAG: 2Fe-2S iron-sulfur cluster-binding protein [Leptothrix ochracea]|uniref:2Fe-2S iron-sulfur cluster-binding protein n=1 Tax=Leptothrix ochracea TaxID=735331 RepID=UPI0034E2A217
MVQVTLAGGRNFEAGPDESMLAAALRAGIALEHSCLTGRCGACKAQISHGQTRSLHEEVGLEPQDRDAGWILSCARSALTDVHLDGIEDLGVPLPPVKTLPCRIQSLSLLAPDVMRVVLRLAPQQTWMHHAGQSIDVIGPGGLQRSYSVANAVSQTQGIQLELHIRHVPGGAMSRYWFEQAKPNDLLRLRGPLGTFFLRVVAERDLIFLTTGTGIAPVKAMLESLARLPHTERPRSVALYWGGRQAADLYWQPPLEHLQRYVPVLSRAHSDWAGARGHVQDVLLAPSPHPLPILSQSTVYACGSDAMVHAARERLIEAGLPPRHFHADAFVCSAPNTAS